MCTYWIKGILCGYAIRSGRHPRPAVGPAAADFSRDVCLTVSRNHKVFPLDHLETKSKHRLCSPWWWWHAEVIKWKHFLRYWPFVRGILRSPVYSPHRGQWRGALMFFFAWTLWCQCNEISYTWQNTRQREIKKTVHTKLPGTRLNVKSVFPV